MGLVKSFVVFITFFVAINSLPAESEEEDVIVPAEAVDAPSSIPETSTPVENEILPEVDPLGVEIEVDTEQLRTNLGLPELSAKIDNLSFELKLWTLVALTLFLLSCLAGCLIACLSEKKFKSKTVQFWPVHENFPDVQQILASNQPMHIRCDPKRPENFTVALH